MEELIYKVDMKEGVAIMTLVFDNITMHQNEELKKAFSTLLNRGNKNIVLDLSKITYISSVVIASLVFMIKRAKEAGGDLVICGVKGKVKEVLEMTNLDKVFSIFDDRQKALDRFVKK